MNAVLLRRTLWPTLMSSFNPLSCLLLFTSAAFFRFRSTKACILDIQIIARELMSSGECCSSKENTLVHFDVLLQPVVVSPLVYICSLLQVSFDDGSLTYGSRWNLSVSLCLPVNAVLLRRTLWPTLMSSFNPLSCLLLLHLQPSSGFIRRWHVSLSSHLLEKSKVPF